MSQPWDCQNNGYNHMWRDRQDGGGRICMWCGTIRLQRKTQKVASGGVAQVEQNTRQDKEERALEAGMIESDLDTNGGDGMSETLPRYCVSATVTNDDIVWLARKAIADSQFSHRHWSLWHAETFEQLATMIRSGYQAETPPTHNQLPAE